MMLGGLEILDSKPLSAGDVLVIARLSPAGKSPATVQWRVHGGEDAHRILDIGGRARA